MQVTSRTVLLVAAVSVMAIALSASAQCETAKLTNPDGKLGDAFGSVAIDGDVVIVGDVTADSFAGAAYVFRRHDSQWRFEAKLVAAGVRSQSDSFGGSVAISGNVAVVSARGRNSPELAAGAVYVYRRGDNGWDFEAELVASDADELDSFGTGIAIDGDVLVVGAAEDENEGLRQSGSAYVFRYNGKVWDEEAKLVDPNRQEGDGMGWSVSVRVDVALISAHGNDAGRGSVLVYRRKGMDWLLEAELVGAETDRDDRFGSSVRLGPPDLAIVGAYNNDNEENGPQSGAAFVFRFDGTSWRQEARLLPLDGNPIEFFGFSVALATDGNTALIGAVRDDEGGFESGSAYVFSYIEGAWSEIVEVVGSDTGPGDQFGACVAISGDRAVIGAPSQLSSPGEAYVFAGLSRIDCNRNGEPDACDIHGGFSEDDDQNGIPDECEGTGDLDSDGDVDFSDLLLLLEAWGPCDLPCLTCVGDIDGDCSVGVSDLLLLLTNWG